MRIIAGKWRGRQLKVPDKQGLRPTPDRVRETLFNWLMPYIAEARCLDLFAGSGVLGFEALSRGAAYVEFVDQSIEVVKLLKDELIQFKADNANIYCANVPEQLNSLRKPFDIVFLDPPYEEKILLAVSAYLEKNNYLARVGSYLSGGERNDSARYFAKQLAAFKSKKSRASMLSFGA